MHDNYMLKLVLCHYFYNKINEYSCNDAPYNSIVPSRTAAGGTFGHCGAVRPKNPELRR